MSVQHLTVSMHCVLFILKHAQLKMVKMVTYFVQSAEFFRNASCLTSNTSVANRFLFGYIPLSDVHGQLARVSSDIDIQALEYQIAFILLPAVHKRLKYSAELNVFYF